MDITNELRPMLDAENAYIIELKDALLEIGEAMTDKAEHDLRLGYRTQSIINIKLKRPRIPSPEELAALERELASAKAINQKWNKAMGEFAAGSEYIDDPPRVAAHLKDSRRLNNMLNEKKRERELAELRRDRDALLNALKMVRTDFLEFEGCYCGQLIGGTNGEGEPLNVCGWCVTDAAILQADALIAASKADAEKERM